MTRSTHTQPPTALPPEIQVLQMILGKVTTLLLFVAARLGLADLLKDGPRSIEHLASAAGVHARSLYRVMRALASLGVFAETEPGHFALTPLAETLRSDVPGSLRDLAIWNGCEFHNLAWADILHGVQTGESNFRHRFGMTVFEHMDRHLADSAIFQNACTAISGREAAWVREAYDFSGFRTLVDVGGGNGKLLATLLQDHPSLKGVLFDLPSVVEGAHGLFRAEGLEGRYEIVGGDFFKAAPQGGAAYLLKHIIHNWDDERCRKILGNCRDAMAPDGKVLVMDPVILPGNDPFLGKLFDIEMLVMTEGGVERTESEFEELFASAGLKLNRIVPTESFLSVIEGVRA